MIRSTIQELYQGMIRLYRWPLIILLAVFMVSIGIGAVLPQDIKVFLLDIIGEKFQTILSDADTPLELTGRIFRNNLMVATIAYILGFTVTLPLLIVLSNGIIIGLFLNLLYRLDAVNPGIFITSFISLIPHGIFELTAFFLAAALSAMVPIKAIWHAHIEPTKSRLRFLYESVLRFFTIIVPFLIIAAFVEVYVSGKLGEELGQHLTRSHQSELLAIELNPNFLLEHNCVVNPRFNEQLVESATNTLATSLVTIAEVVYHEPTYIQLQQRKSLPYWEEHYACNNELLITVQAWSTQQWSLQQAQRLRSSMLDAVKPSQLAPEQAEPYLDQLLQYNDKTVAIKISNPEITVEEVLGL